MTGLIIGLAVAMVFSAFFSGLEIAFVSSNRLLAEMDREKNGFSQRALSVFYHHPNIFVSTMLVGNNIALVIYGILFARIFDTLLFSGLSDGMRVTADTLLSTLVVLFTGEFLPKTIFKSNPNTLLTFFAVPAFICYVLLYPISRFATLLSRGILRLVGIRMEKESDEKEFTRVDLDYLVQTSIDNAKNEEDIEEEVKIFQNALEFTETRVRDCMVPRTEIDAVEDTCGIEQLKQVFIESGHSKVVVYHEDIDHVIGYIHSSEMFHNPQDWRQAIRQLSFVPETMQASRLMKTFMQQQRSLAIVVDEFGGTSGLVTLEDILEEIVGEINDEYDEEEKNFVRINANTYIFEGKTLLSDFYKVLRLDDDTFEDIEGDADTLAGLMLELKGDFPVVHEKLEYNNFTFEILELDERRISKVKVIVHEEPTNLSK